MKRSRFRAPFLLVVPWLLLSACGGPAGDGGEAVPDPEVRQVGFVLLAEAGPADARRVHAHGTFVERTDPLGELAATPFGAAADTCSVAASSSAAAGDASLGPAVDGRAVGAGAALVVTHEGAPLLDLPAAAEGRYVLPAGAAPAAALPDGGLALDVPGDAFGRFDGVAFAPAAPVAFDAAFDPQAVRGDTAFAWAPGDAEASTILLVARDGDTVVACVAADDGAFAFDDAGLDLAGFDGGLTTVARLSVASSTRGEATLVLGVLRQEVVE